VAAERELARVKSEIEKVIDAIVDGVPGTEVKARMVALQDRKDILLNQLECWQRDLTATPLPQPLSLPHPAISSTSPDQPSV
jgi:hypothetical protein